MQGEYEGVWKMRSLPKLSVLIALYLCIASALLLFHGLASAAPGEFDPAFGVGGIRATHFGIGSTADTASAMVRQPDGKLLVAGYNGLGVAVIRMDASGRLDSSWGIGGKATFRVNLDGQDWGLTTSNMKLDGNGNVYVLGRFQGAAYMLGADFIAKLNSSGELVASFGVAGVHILTQQDCRAATLALDGSGRLFVAGYCASNGAIVMKFDPNGNPDESYGSHGKWSAGMSAGGIYPAALTFDAAGDLYMAGHINVSHPATTTFVLLKLDRTGKPADGFGQSGQVVIALDAQPAVAARALQFDASGNLYVAGSIVSSDGPTGFAVVKLDRNGNVLPFSINGMTVLNRSGAKYGFMSAMAIDSRGFIFLAGYSSNSVSNTDRLTVAKLDANGTLVTDFGSGGISSELGGSGRDMALDPDGGIYTLVNSYDFRNDFAVAKLDANGRLDAGFGSAGVQNVDVQGPTHDSANAMAIDRDGNIYLAGASGFYPSGFGLMKLDSGGNLVRSFGTDGKALIAKSANSPEEATALALDEAGNIFVAGRSDSAQRGTVIAKLDVSGALVNGFGQGGKVSMFPFDGSALVRDRGGNLYVGGKRSVAKLDADGRFVASFGVGGIKNFEDDRINVETLALDECGALYVGGSTSDFSIVVQKLDFNGNPVAGFGSGGKVVLNYKIPGQQISASRIVLDSQGNIYVSGPGFTDFLTEGPRYFDMVIKLDATGNPVPGFGSGGRIMRDYERISAMAVDANANLYVAGGFYGADVVMLDANGNLVPGFGNGGKLDLPATNAHSLAAVNALGLDADGRVLLAGPSHEAEFAVARLQGMQIPPPSGYASPVYRFFNNPAGVHFYTISAAERDSVLGTLPQFRFEGRAYDALPGPVAGASPVYRFFNTGSGSHFYTISEPEKTAIVNGLPGLRFEGVAYYACPAPAPGMSAVHRFFNATSGAHFFTNSAAERDQVLSSYPWYRYEGTAFFAAP